MYQAFEILRFVVLQFIVPLYVNTGEHISAQALPGCLHTRMKNGQPASSINPRAHIHFPRRPICSAHTHTSTSFVDCDTCGWGIFLTLIRFGAPDRNKHIKCVPPFSYLGALATKNRPAKNATPVRGGCALAQLRIANKLEFSHQI